MVQEGKAHEAEDKKAREVIEKRNRLDGLVLEIEKTVGENKDKLAEADVQTVTAAVEKAKTALKEHENNADELEKATNELSQTWYKVAEQLYKQQQAQGGQPGSEQPEGEKPEGQGPIDTDAQ